VVRIDDVTKIFHRGEVNEVTAVEQVSLHVPRGQFLVVIGGNGSGKSTLLNLVAGTVFPDRGAISVDGDDLTRVPEYKRSAMLGRVFQDPLRGTSAGLTIEENFALAASRGEFRGLSRALGTKLRTEIRDRLELLGLGLEGRMKTKVGLLSGGQRQAITIMMAVFRRPLVLLLDEHTAALDPRASRTIMDLTRRIVAEHHLTTLMITHNLAHALDSGDRTVMMSRGRIVHDLSDERRARMTVQDLLALFWETQTGEEAPSELLRPGECSSPAS
jgi:putative ABC transport system ATP-binding protein